MGRNQYSNTQCCISQGAHASSPWTPRWGARGAEDPQCSLFPLFLAPLAHANLSPAPLCPTIRDFALDGNITPPALPVSHHMPNSARRTSGTCQPLPGPRHPALGARPPVPNPTVMRPTHLSLQFRQAGITACSTDHFSLWSVVTPPRVFPFCLFFISNLHTGTHRESRWNSRWLESSNSNNASAPRADWNQGRWSPRISPASWVAHLMPQISVSHLRLNIRAQSFHPEYSPSSKIRLAEPNRKCQFRFRLKWSLKRPKKEKLSCHGSAPIPWSPFSEQLRDQSSWQLCHLCEWIWHFQFLMLRLS